MPRNNLRTALDAFAENVRYGIKTTLRFDGKTISLTAERENGQPGLANAMVGVTSDLTDDTLYRLIGDDIDEVAGEKGVQLTEDEWERVKKGIEAGFGNDWWDIVASAIDDAVAERGKCPYPPGLNDGEINDEGEGKQ